MSGNTDRLAAALADRYRIERQLGQGGMATVYLASDLKHDRKVALKVLKPELAAVLGAERFVVEIKTTASLQHPHILPLFDSGTADGFLYYLMPFIEGETLRGRLNRETQLGIEEAVRITTQVADALDYAHRHGVIHRDIKPENILLHDGRPMVADFGIALAVSAAAGGRMTETGLSLGTPHYMSPEQATADKDITARSDIYSLASVLYEMLAGEPPHTGSSAQQIIMKIIAESAQPVTAMRKSVPPNVAAALAKALEKLPADRFESASAFAAALNAPPGAITWQTHAPSQARTIDWRIAAALGVLVGAAAAAALLMTRDASRSSDSGARRQLTFNGHSWSPAISPDGEYVAFVEIRCPRGDFNPCNSSLLVQARGSDRPVSILRDLSSIGTPRFTHDGTTLVVPAQLDSGRVGLFAVPRLGGVPRQVAPRNAFDTHAHGDTIVIVRWASDDAPAKAMVIALASGATVDSVQLPRGAISAIGWSPDGRLLAIVEEYAKLTIVRRDGSVADTLRGPFRPVVRWTPDGSGVLIFRALPVKEDDLDFYRIDSNGRLTRKPEVRVAAIQTLLNGEFDVARRTGDIAMTSGGINFDLWTFDLASPATPARQRTSGTTWYGAPVITPDGKRLLYMRGDATGDNLYVLNEDDSEEALTAERFPGMGAASVSRDGRRAVFGHAAPGGARFGVMDLATRQATFVTQTGASSTGEPFLVTNGLAFVRADRRGLFVRELPGDVERAIDFPDSLSLWSVQPDPSGDSIAVIVVGASQATLAVSPLAKWSPRWLYSFKNEGTTRIRGWDNAGNVHFWQWAAGDDAPSVWRIPVAGGRPVQVRSLPTACNTPAIDVAVAAPRGACAATDARGDIWLLHVPGVTR